jgi:hypothetical protein
MRTPNKTLYTTHRKVLGHPSTRHHPTPAKCPRHFTPSLINNICQTDSLRLSGKTTKDTKVEVRKTVSPGLVRWVKEKGGREPGDALVVTEVMLFAEAGGLDVNVG